MARDRIVLVKQVKAASDIVAVVSSYLPLQPAGAVFKGLCPFHDDSRPSLQVDPNYQNFRCWACGKKGDVITFVMEMERLDFRSAVEALAERAGIVIDDTAGDPGLRSLRSALAWAAQQFHECLLESALATAARKYIAGRGLEGTTIRAFSLGFAPGSGQWLIEQASRVKGITLQNLLDAGLLGRSSQRDGFYDRFRDRVMFPIRDLRGQVVGFGGRILPGSAHETRGPKYYNSCETPLFTKSELLYGLDTSRQAAARAGFLAVVEGYTDVLMAHQMGIENVVATMGTALTDRHIKQMRRVAPRVVLVFDADAGGMTGVDRALELFLSQDVDLRIAQLPDGLDPCDLLVQQGAEPMRAALSAAQDALEYKIDQVLARDRGQGLAHQSRGLQELLGVIALIPVGTDPAARLKRELVLNRLSQRFGVEVTTLKRRLNELTPGQSMAEPSSLHSVPRVGKAPSEERELLEVLLAEPSFVPLAQAEIAPEDMTHPVGRQLLTALYDLHTSGITADVDGLRVTLSNESLIRKAMELAEVGRENKNRAAWLRDILGAFRRRSVRQQTKRLYGQLGNVDDESALQLLRQLQEQSRSNGSHPERDSAGPGS